jgi:hypothetical protein
VSNPTNSLICREADGELLVLDSRTSRLHRLNATATLIYRLHEQGLSALCIASALVDVFEVEPGRAMEDVMKTTSQLTALGLLQAD